MPKSSIGRIKGKQTNIEVVVYVEKDKRCMVIIGDIKVWSIIIPDYSDCARLPSC